MADNSRNSLAKLISQVKQLQLVEQLLSRSEGATVEDISQAAGCSARHARRLIGALKELGCTITDDFVIGTREAATFHIEGHEHTHGRPFGAGNSIRFALAKSRGEKPCPHYIDNQGFCHKCGILMDEGLARDSGYWQEGMVEGK